MLPCHLLVPIRAPSLVEDWEKRNDVVKIDRDVYEKTPRCAFARYMARARFGPVTLLNWRNVQDRRTRTVLERRQIRIIHYKQNYTIVKERLLFHSLRTLQNIVPGFCIEQFKDLDILDLFFLRLGEKYISTKI